MLYINPNGQTKEEWLEKYATETKLEDFSYAEGTGILTIVLVDNGAFTACGVAPTEQEFSRFLSNNDKRPKRYFYATYADVLAVLPTCMHEELINHKP